MYKKKCISCKKIKTYKSFYSNGFQSNSHRKKYKPSCKRCYDVRRWKKHWRRIEEIIGDLKCSKCGYDFNLAALEFHHKNRNKKEININLCKTHSLVKLKIELKKCILLCANCHRDRHHRSSRKSVFRGNMYG